MIVIISPAKKMKDDIAWMDAQDQPILLKDAKRLIKYLKTLTIPQIQRVLMCSEKIAQEAYIQYEKMRITNIGVPAILSYEGIQYQYMAPDVFTDDQFTYIQKYVRILSGLYGVLIPLDHVMPYRLELHDKIKYQDYLSLYDFWKYKVYKEIIKEDREILDLASAQYSKLLYKYQTNKVRIVKCRFMEENKGICKEKGVYVKMARGSMVRWLAEENITCLDEVKKFCRDGYLFNEALSNEHEFVYIRKS